ncbi:MAG: response regulator, partial [Gammaproteobacteria bacterium]|nr:response regulator [Gammaproteobacteria bacterium]
MNELKLRVLVLEDNEEDFLRLERLLAGAAPGCQIRRARTPADAAATIPQFAFDACLVGGQVAGVSGIEQLPLILELRPYAPIVMLDERPDSEFERRALAQGASDVLSKSNLSA